MTSAPSAPSALSVSPGLAMPPNLCYPFTSARGVAPEWACPTLFFEGSTLSQASVSEAIRAVAQRVVDGRGWELVDVEVKREREGHLVRLFVDKDGGIGLDDLQSVSEEVSAILDAEDPIASSYTLEVSSPGLDRALKTEADYRRFAGRLARV